MSFWASFLYGEKQDKRFRHMVDLEKEIDTLIKLRNNNPSTDALEEANKQITQKKSDFDLYKTFWETENSRMNRTFAVIAGYLGAAGLMIPIMKDVYKSLYGTNKEYANIYLIGNVLFILLIFFIPLVFNIIRVTYRWSVRRRSQ
ncbi:hypothetical protein [Gluconobacter oxydans]|uniref:hypothetical protein n=1 Tax=Gluconobacter oxydans TaxID=442 RepID=UPI00062C9EA4|nr:hypothetical protein [Gluconobacter oxydans]